MAGPRPKSEAQRQRRNASKKPAPNSRVLPAGVAQLPMAPPTPRSRWSSAVKEAWATFWVSPITAAVDRALHEPALRRLFDLRDEREKVFAIASATPIVLGSQEQERAHPLYARLGAIESEIRNLEDRFGLNPKAMADLGISFAGAKRSLEELASDASDDEELGDEDDPRVLDVTATEGSRVPKDRQA